MTMATQTCDIPNDIFFSDIETNFLSKGMSVVFVAKGRSMMPFIHDKKDKVEVVRLKREPIVGDVVLVHIGQNYILHRIISIKGEALTLKGDGNLVNVEHCLTSDIMGTATAIIRPNGKKRPIPSGRFWNSLGRKPKKLYLAVVRKLEIILGDK